MHRWFIRSLALAFILLAFFLPLLRILVFSFFQHGDFDTRGLETILFRRYYARLIGFTILQAFLSTIFTALVALPAAYFLGRYRFRGRSLLLALLTAPFVMPTVVVALAFLALLPTLRGTIWILLLAHAFYNCSVFIRFGAYAFGRVDRSQIEAAQLLGAGPWRCWTTVILPLVLPTLLAAAVIVFTFSFTSFGVLLILGFPELVTMEVQIYSLTAKRLLLGTAAPLALFQMFFTFGLLYIYARLTTKASVQQKLHRPYNEGIPGGVSGMLLWGYLFLLSMFILAPLAALGREAFTDPIKGDWAIVNFQNLFDHESFVGLPSASRAILNSIFYGLLTTLVAVPLGVGVAYIIRWSGSGRGSATLDSMFMLPIGVSAVTMGLGFLLTFNRGWFDLRATRTMIVLAHVLLAYPFVVRVALPTLLSLDQGLSESARCLGAGPFRVWRTIELPLLWRALLVGATFSLAISLGEFGATLVLTTRPEFTSIPALIGKFLDRPGPVLLGMAQALGFILLVMTTMIFILIERFRGREDLF